LENRQELLPILIDRHRGTKVQVMGIKPEDAQDPAGLREVALDDLFRYLTSPRFHFRTFSRSSNPISLKSSMGDTKFFRARMRETAAVILGEYLSVR